MALTDAGFIDYDIDRSVVLFTMMNDTTRVPCAITTDAMDQIEGVNNDEVATKILALQTALQASYQTTSQLFQLTLTKYLPPA